MSNDDRIAQWKAKREQAVSAGAKDRKLARGAMSLLRREQARETENQAEALKANAIRETVPDFPPSHVSNAGAQIDDSRAASPVLAKLDADRARRGRLTTYAVISATLVSLLYVVAFLSPLMTAETSMSVQRIGGGDGAAGGMLGLGGAGKSDAFEIETLLESAAAMQALEAHMGFVNSFRQETDIFTRPHRIALLGRDELSFYRNRVSASVNPQSGIITLRVEAKTATDAIAASNALIELSETYMSNRSERLIDTQLATYTQRTLTARGRVDALVAELTALKQIGTDRERTRDAAARLDRVSRLETELTGINSRLAALAEANVRSGARVSGLEGQKRSLLASLDRAKRDSNKGDGSADIRTREARVAEKELEIDLARQGYTAALAAYDGLRQQVEGQRAELGVVAGPLARSVPSARRGALHLIGLTLSLLALIFLMLVPLRGLSLRKLGQS